MDWLKDVLPAWAVAVVMMVLSAFLVGLTIWQQTDGDWVAVGIGVIGSLLGVGAIGAKGISGGGEPPSGAAVVTP